jgi:hypothetical protein
MAGRLELTLDSQWGTLVEMLVGRMAVATAYHWVFLWGAHWGGYLAGRWVGPMDSLAVTKAEMLAG